MNRPSRTTLPAALATLGLAMAVAACQTGGAGTASAVASAGTAAVVAVSSSSELGEFLVDAEGRTLYIFLNDSPGASTCSGDCATNWPPATIGDDQTPAGSGLTGELGTLERDDGSLQLTLDGWPLYRFAGAADAGDTAGEGVGGVWFVARPDGSLPSPNGEPSAEPSAGESADDSGGTYDPYDY
jgi:predicted lipoprotein with Yx(FWY)xxD motif